MLCYNLTAAVHKSSFVIVLNPHTCEFSNTIIAIINLLSIMVIKGIISKFNSVMLLTKYILNPKFSRYSIIATNNLFVIQVFS